jgi:hypothetical protein
MALSYARYGLSVDEKNIQQGDIVVFDRGLPGQGHVTFFDHWTAPGILCCLGGNQDDQVCYANYATDRVVAYRRPGPDDDLVLVLPADAAKKKLSGLAASLAAAKAAAPPKRHPVDVSLTAGGLTWRGRLVTD